MIDREDLEGGTGYWELEIKARDKDAISTRRRRSRLFCLDEETEGTREKLFRYDENLKEDIGLFIGQLPIN